MAMSQRILIFKILSFISLLDNSAWKGPQEVSSSNSCSKQDHLWGQARSLSTLLPGTLKPLRMETTQPVQATFSPWGQSSSEQSFSFHWVGTSLGSVFACYFLSSHHAPLFYFLSLYSCCIFLFICSAFHFFFSSSYYITYQNLSLALSSASSSSTYFKLIILLETPLPKTHLSFTFSFFPAVSNLGVTLPILHHI